LNLVWTTVMEKPWEWSMAPSWSMGFKWPWNGHGTRTTRPCLGGCSSINLPLNNFDAAYSSKWRRRSEAVCQRSACFFHSSSDYKIIRLDLNYSHTLNIWYWHI
jgi:hypothetical protein